MVKSVKKFLTFPPEKSVGWLAGDEVKELGTDGRTADWIRTRISLSKNLVYKNVEAQIKNILVNLLVAISTSYSASDEIEMFL